MGRRGDPEEGARLGRGIGGRSALLLLQGAPSRRVLVGAAGWAAGRSPGERVVVVVGRSHEHARAVVDRIHGEVAAGHSLEALASGHRADMGYGKAVAAVDNRNPVAEGAVGHSSRPRQEEGVLR